MSSHHDHDHPHATLPDAGEHLTYYQAMEVAVRELLIEKGIVSADEVRRQVEDMDGRNAGMGAKVVAHAWVDPAYKQRLLTDGNSAAPRPRMSKAQNVDVFPRTKITRADCKAWSRST